MSKLELVAPAGGWDQLVAAINAGADSVYLGYKRFGARAYAENFDLAGLKRAVGYAHSKARRIYLTVNTLLKDQELEDATHFISDYLNICSDGIIVQDIGLASLLRKLFGDIRLHASTQMNTHNLKSALFLKDAGFKRLVPARELSLEDIEKIKKSDLEMEVFCHGSQCFSFSGQCLFSSFTGQRSGNRGRCPQPCRMRYRIVSERSNNNKDFIKTSNHILSKDDLCTLDLLPMIADMGIEALKIEGRMKSAEYVAIVVKTYRDYIDKYYSDPKGYKIEPRDLYKIKQIFSRDVSPGYFLDNYSKKIISGKKAGSVGNLLGRIRQIKYAKNNTVESIVLRSKWPISKGDILEIWTNRGNERINVKDFTELGSYQKTGKTDYRIGIDNPVHFSENDRVFMFLDKALDEEARQIYGKTRYFQKKSKSQGKDDLFKSNIDDYFKRLGPERKIALKLGILPVVYETGYIKMLEEEGITKMMVDIEGLKKHDINYMIKDKKEKTKIVLKTPVIIYDKNMKAITDMISAIAGREDISIEISNPGLLNFVKEKGINTGIYTGQALNVFNSLTFRYLSGTIGRKLLGIELSPELTLEEIKEISARTGDDVLREKEIMIYGYGYNPLMRVRYRLDYYLKDYAKKMRLPKERKDFFIEDRKRYRFRMVQETDSLLFLNSRRTCTLFDLDKILDAGIDSLKIDTRTLDKRSVFKVIDTFRKASRILSGDRGKYFAFIDYFKEDVMFKDYSKAHLFRGVK